MPFTLNHAGMRAEGGIIINYLPNQLSYFCVCSLIQLL